MQGEKSVDIIRIMIDCKKYFEILRRYDHLIQSQSDLGSRLRFLQFHYAGHVLRSVFDGIIVVQQNSINRNSITENSVQN